MLALVLKNNIKKHKDLNKIIKRSSDGFVA